MQPDRVRTRFVALMVVVAFIALIGVILNPNTPVFLVCAISLLIANLASLIAIRTRRGQIAHLVAISAWVMIDLGALWVAVLLIGVILKSLLKF
jgi:hypothetical protein